MPVAPVLEAAKRAAQLIIDEQWYTPGMLRAVRGLRDGSLGAAPALADSPGSLLPRELRGFARNSEDWGTARLGPDSHWWR